MSSHAAGRTTARLPTIREGSARRRTGAPAHSNPAAPRVDAASQGERAAQKPSGCTALKVRQLSRRVSQHFDRIVGHAGLKTTQYSLLTAVIGLGPLRPGELAATLQMDASTLTRNLQPMVAQGWLAIGPGADGRSRAVSATAAGRQKRAEAQREWKRAQSVLNAQLGESTVFRLHALIDECSALLDEAAEVPEAA